MPVRGEVKEVAKSEAVAKPEVKTPARKVPTKAEVEPKKEEVVKKSILEEKVKKYLADVGKELPSKIFEIFERMLTSKENGEKSSVVFLAFSTNGEKDEEVDDVANVEMIKDVLFHYHTAQDKMPTGKIMVVEVITPQEADEPHLVCFQEV